MNPDPGVFVQSAQELFCPKFYLLESAPMRRWLAIFLLVLLPLQFTWAAVGGYCQHETGIAANHFGHHDHQHKTGGDGTPDAKTLGAADNDCSCCHAACCFAATLGDVGLPLLVTASDVVSCQPDRHSFLSGDQPERPNWSVLA